MEGSPSTATREHDAEEMDVETAFTKADDRRSGSSPSEVSKIPSPLPNCITDEHPRQSTPPSVTQVVSTDKEEKCKVEVDDHEMNVEMNDDDNVTIVPPITATPNSVGRPDAEQDIQVTDESRIFKEEQEVISDLEMRRQRQRQALRGPTPSSSPQVHSRKASLVVSKTGVKRDREEYEEGQVDEDGHDREVGIDDDTDNVLEENPKNSAVQDHISTETQGIVADAVAEADDNSEGEIVILERELKDDVPKRQKEKKVSTDTRQVMPQMEIKKVPALGKVPNPKALGKRSHYRDFISPPISLTNLKSFTQQQSTISQPLPSPQPRLPKKLGINHMDLLYKTEREVMVCRFCL